MSGSTKIEWSDSVWNPLAGCTWDSPGCDHCYAAVMAHRLGFMAEADIAAGRNPGQKRKYVGITNKNRAGRIMFNGRVNLDHDALNEPFRWKKPRRVFVNSMSDLFHKDVPDSFIDRVFGVMAATPQHTYQVLTKRPERMAEYLNGYGRDTLIWIEAYSAALTDQLKHNKPAWPLPNVWIGTSVENQEQADARIPHLLRVPARVRFLSCEPLLSGVILQGDGEYDNPSAMRNRSYLRGVAGDARIHWLIVGGESGPGARPMHPEWARSLRDQCQAAGVSYFFKQHGEWVSFAATPNNVSDDSVGPGRCRWVGLDGSLRPIGRGVMEDTDAFVYRVGKHAAGRLLDGREHNDFPHMEHTHA